VDARSAVKVLGRQPFPFFRNQANGNAGRWAMIWADCKPKYIKTKTKSKPKGQMVAN
jgi:hypothetical protein